MNLAADRNGVILSTDSMQVYRGMDIGTAKPSVDDQSRVPHEMIDVADPAVDFTVADFQRDARRALELRGDDFVVVAGGSGLHMRSVVDPMEFPPHDPKVRAEVEALPEGRALSELRQADPAVADVLDTKNSRRVIRALEIIKNGGPTPSERVKSPEYRQLKEYVPLFPFAGFGFDPGEAIEARVRDRVRAMISSGLVDEVASLQGALGKAASQAVGYKELLGHVAGTADLETAEEEVVSTTLRLVKRQRTYFRRDPRITWLEWDDDPIVRSATLSTALDRLTP